VLVFHIIGFDLFYIHFFQLQKMIKGGDFKNEKKGYAKKEAAEGIYSSYRTVYSHDLICHE
jgi:hypothetical protein